MIRYPSQINSQSGVTLLMSILIMSTILLISVTISAFVIQEIRASRSSMLTEPAIIGAESAGEQGLYFLKQTGSIPATCTTSTYGGFTPPNDSSACSTSTTVRLNKTVVYGPVTLDLKAGEVYEFFLYDPTDIQGNIALEDGGGSPLFSSVSVQHVSGTAGLNSDVTVISNTVAGTPVASGVVSQGGIFTFDSYNIPGAIGNDKRQLVSLSVAQGTATVVVSSTGSFGSGIPNFPTIQADACSANTNISNCNTTNTEVFRRRINITVPTTP
jgi:hypothetical protein